jgi:hypothetical protein
VDGFAWIERPIIGSADLSWSDPCLFLLDPSHVSPVPPTFQLVSLFPDPHCTVSPEQSLFSPANPPQRAVRSH